MPLFCQLSTFLTCVCSNNRILGPFHGGVSQPRAGRLILPSHINLERTFEIDHWIYGVRSGGLVILKSPVRQRRLWARRRGRSNGREKLSFGWASSTRHWPSFGSSDPFFFPCVPVSLDLRTLTTLNRQTRSQPPRSRAAATGPLVTSKRSKVVAKPAAGRKGGRQAFRIRLQCSPGSSSGEPFTNHHRLP